jgi:hypothetical protein
MEAPTSVVSSYVGKGYEVDATEVEIEFGGLDGSVRSSSCSESESPTLSLVWDDSINSKSISGLTQFEIFLLEGEVDWSLFTTSDELL